MNEIRGKLPNFNGIFVSNAGRVKRWDGFIYKLLDSRNGYKQVKLLGKKRLVHRLVAATFLGLDLNNSKELACHKNDIRYDNRPDNLFIGTHKSNYDDMVKKGRRKSCKGKILKSHAYGSMIGNSIFRNIDIIIIRYYNRIGISTSKIAKHYNADRSTVSSILKGETRRHVI